MSLLSDAERTSSDLVCTIAWVPTQLTAYAFEKKIIAHLLLFSTFIGQWSWKILFNLLLLQDLSRSRSINFCRAIFFIPRVVPFCVIQSFIHTDSSARTRMTQISGFSVMGIPFSAMAENIALCKKRSECIPHPGSYVRTCCSNRINRSEAQILTAS